MKKFLTLIACGLALVSGTTMSHAQSATPRFGTATNQDATYRSQKLALVTVADTIGTTCDTLSVSANALHTYVKFTLSDSASLAASVTGCHFGDRLTVVVYNTAGSGHYFYLTPQKGASIKWRYGSSNTNKISMTASKNAVLSFVFDGTAWSEIARSIQ